MPSASSCPALRRLRPVLAATLICGASSAQLSVRSSFEFGTESWTQAGATTFLQQPSGGNPGGYLEIDNSEGPITYIHAPAKFLGDLRMFDGGTLRFDGNMTGTGGTPWPTPGFDYGHVTIVSPNGQRTVDLTPGLPTNGSWTTYSVNFDVATFGGTQGTWTSILSSVTEIRMSVEALFGNEVQGIDNFELKQRPSAGSSVLCNGDGSNPVILRNTSSLAPAPAPSYDAPVIGKNWRIELDCNPSGTIGAPAIFRMRFGPKATPATTVFGDLLVAGPGEQTTIAVPGDRIVKFALLVPNSTVLVGTTYVVQGLCPATPKYLGNALLEVIGD